MSQILFSFTLNTETNESETTGNIAPRMALQVLQGIIIKKTVDLMLAESKREVMEKAPEAQKPIDTAKEADSGE